MALFYIDSKTFLIKLIICHETWEYFDEDMTTAWCYLPIIWKDICFTFRCVTALIKYLLLMQKPLTRFESTA